MDAEKRARYWLALLAAAALYALSVTQMSGLSRKSTDSSMQVRLPIFIQVLLTGGDRFLAADINVWRSLVVDLEKVTPEQYHVQALLQMDAAWLNPRHEDNYYFATWILPWNGYVDEAQKILEQASKARRNDWQPGFYYAFNAYHFKHDYIAAASKLNEMLPRATNEDDRRYLSSYAAHWFERGYEATQALQMVEHMAKVERSPGLKLYLSARATRLRGLIVLQTAAEQFRRQYARPPATFDELVSARLIDKVPDDPLGVGYILAAEGVPLINNQPTPTKP